MEENRINRIIFLCHGNICRSPMAEYVMKSLVARAGRADDFLITSAAVSYEEEGNPMYPPARRTLAAHDIPFGDHRAHRITPEEAAAADLILVMDRSNRRLLSHIVPAACMEKVSLLLSHAGQDRDVADPWYTGDFEKAYRDILSGCEALLQELLLPLH